MGCVKMRFPSPTNASVNLCPMIEAFCLGAVGPDRTAVDTLALMRRCFTTALVILLTLTACVGPPSTAQPTAFPYPPLWPFASQQEAERWLIDGAARAENPWHGEAAETAVRFTQDFLGFTEINRALHVTDEGNEAWVDVGYEISDGKERTAAAVHLARFGDSPDAPWEVVGTRDAMLTLDTPAYGSIVAGSAIDAGGIITGVDECVHLAVLQGPARRVLGEFSCLMTGGDKRPWSARLPMNGAAPGVVTLAAWTGGHHAEVERFAVTGLRVE
ncbi:hypothetical protein H7J93_07240 [Mycobacterium barrassiae]|uniref:hypothetical protein n=1 Tax=Mycobacterium barrassiae TaxID=319709 RepID=UPI00226589BA|nr:hypothetical protein [Mycobacterium barrassiae]MCV7299432.1 hypothetical protein [Mycobacterium barrassiae]